MTKRTTAQAYQDRNIRRLTLFTIAASLIILVYVAIRWPPSLKTKNLGTKLYQSTLRAYMSRGKENQVPWNSSVTRPGAQTNVNSTKYENITVDGNTSAPMLSVILAASSLSPGRNYTASSQFTPNNVASHYSYISPPYIHKTSQYVEGKVASQSPPTIHKKSANITSAVSIYSRQTSHSSGQHGVNVFNEGNYSEQHSTGSAGRYWCMWYNGRLGNLMFQYASVLGLSKAHNKSMLLPENDVLYTNFELPSAVVAKNFSICKTFVQLIEKECCTYDHRLTNVTSNVNYQFLYYLQSWKYFLHVEDDVRREFTFRRPVREKAMAIVEQARKSYPDDSVNATVVGIHIRRGDILNDDHKKLGFQTANKTYIHNAIDYFISKYQHVVFVVCSNDANYSKEALVYNNISAIFQSFSDTEDIAILSSCDHMIMTVGTFGWWAGFLSGGIVVYYKYPYKDGSDYGNKFTMEDYYLPAWIGIE